MPSSLEIGRALRNARRRPGFTAVVIGTLAVGFAAVTAVFSVIDSVLLRQLPFPHASQLVWIGTRRPGYPVGPTLATLLEWRAHARSLTSVAGYAAHDEPLAGIRAPQQIAVGFISPSFFATLGIRPEMGRGFVAADNRLGAPPVAIIADSLWRATYGSDPHIIGRLITLDRTPTEVVGVMPPEAMMPGTPVAAWTPLRPGLGFAATDPAVHVAGAIGRLRPGWSMNRAAGELRTLAGRTKAARPTGEPTRRGRFLIDVVPLRRFVVGNARPLLLLVLGASALVLLVTCANVANLLLTRATARQQEMAIRRAIGASHSRILQQLLAESAVYAIGAGLTGVVIARWTTTLIATLGARQIPRTAEVALHPDALLFAGVLVAATTVLFGFVPAAHAAAMNAGAILKGSARQHSATAAHLRGREMLVIAEVSISLVLLASAGVLGKSVARLLGAGPGFAPDHVIVVSLMRPLGVWPGNKAPMRAFGAELVDRLEALPAVRSAAISLELPATRHVPVLFRRHPNASGIGDSLVANGEVVTPDYFRTLALPLLRGRTFDARDGPSAEQVIVISRSVAKRLFPGENPIGHALLAPGDDATGPPPEESYRVVGEVGDVRAPGPAARGIPEVYSPFAQGPVPHMTVLVRSQAGPAALGPAIARAVRSIDPTQPIGTPRTLDEILAQSAARPAFYLALLGAFALIALVLAAVGLYATIAASVRQRTREIGVRVALGADRGGVMRLVLGRAARLVAIGLVAGLAGALAATRLLDALLSGVSATDPFVFVAVMLVLAAVAALASYLPVREALRVDPVIALRSE